MYVNETGTARALVTIEQNLPQSKMRLGAWMRALLIFKCDIDKGGLACAEDDRFIAYAGRERNRPCPLPKVILIKQASPAM